MCLPDLSCNIANLPLDGFIMNASGPKCTTEQELSGIAASQSAASVTKSCTIHPRSGNIEPRYQNMPLGSIQSMGLPNLGYRAYLEMMPRLKSQSKPVIASVSGFSLDENVAMVKAFMRSEVDAIEVNFSCPNIEGKPQLAYDFEQMERQLKALCDLGDKPLGIKLAPYFDMAHFDSVANIIQRHAIKFVTCINSIGNALIIDPIRESPVIKPKQGFGGLCGDYVKPLGLANVRAFKQRLPVDIQVIGVGGIKSGTDAFEYLLAGADAVQIATCFEKEGINCFARIQQELLAMMKVKGYQSLSAVRGKLRDL